MNALVAGLVVLIAMLFVPFFIPDPDVSDDITELPESIQAWHERGSFMMIGDYKLFYVHNKCSMKENAPNFVLIHGYPSSSYDYHKAIDQLLQRGNVFVHDHLGFGLSDKPEHNFTYSISEAADNCIIAWRRAGIKSAHLVAHDMGDTVLTEILARRHRGLLPDYFSDFFLSITFTNGGMLYSAINFRIGQLLLKNVYIGPYFSKVANRLRIAPTFATKQLRTIWGPDFDVEERDRDIAALVDLVGFKGGAAISSQLIYYLWDRAHFEFRWFAALAHLDRPVRFIWGDSDEVSPTEICESVASFVPKAELIYMKRAGHFIMLEQPSKWVELVSNVLD